MAKRDRPPQAKASSSWKAPDPAKSKSASFARLQEEQDQQLRRTGTIALVLLGAVAAPFLFSGKDMRRNLYDNREDCVADYSEMECPTNAEFHPYSDHQRHRVERRYHGPWYEAGARTRTPKDPGPGRYQESRSSLSGFDRSGLRAPAGSEIGYRGGFGRSGAVRAGS